MSLVSALCLLSQWVAVHNIINKTSRQDAQQDMIAPATLSQANVANLASLNVLADAGSRAYTACAYTACVTTACVM